MAIMGSYSEIYDMNTMDGVISAIKFHTPQDGTPVSQLGGLFAQFRKYKYLGADMALIPAQQLPLDPLQVSSVEGDNLADPRDVLNPILHKHWNGERTLLDWYISTTFTTNIGATGGVGEQSRHNESLGHSIDETLVPLASSTTQNNAVRFYSSLLMDRSWRGAHVQQGMRVRMRPMVWDVQSTRPFSSYADLVSDPANRAEGMLGSANVGPARNGIGPTPLTEPQTSNIITGKTEVNRTPGGSTLTRGYVDDWQFMTSGMMPMGWIPTNNAMKPIATPVGDLSNMSEISRIRLPKVYMHLMVLPPAFKTNFYYRLVIKHKFLFKDMTSLRTIDAIDSQTAYDNGVVWAQLPTPESRLQTIAESTKVDHGENSAMEIFGAELKPMGGSFEFKENVTDEWGMDEQQPKAQTLEEQIEAILNARETKGADKLI